MDDSQSTGLSADDLAAESVTVLPDKEVVSILDLNADLDLAIDAAAPSTWRSPRTPMWLPRSTPLGANIPSVGSTAQALSDQGVMINQDITADATAESTQDSIIEQGAGSEADTTMSTEPSDGLGGFSDGNLVNVNVNVDLAADADITAPINGAVAANANVAAPIDAAVAANIGSIDSNAVAVAQQDAIISQNTTGEAAATADQTSDISQADPPQP